MYAFLRGILIENNPTYVILDVQGVGYKVFIPPNALNLPIHQTYTFHTSLVLRENTQNLYGFLEEKGRDLFELLIGINGIGPKTALCLLSKFSPTALQKTVLEKDTRLLATVPGIGKKTADRLVFDLQDKLSKISFGERLDPPQQNIQDALQALMNLGFSQSNAKKAIDKVVKGRATPMELSQIITEALRNP